MPAERASPSTALRQNFTIKALREAYERVSKTVVTGTDRVHPSVFSKRLEAELRVIRDRILGGTYKFSPYRQILNSRGATRAPREISIATVRDRIALHGLKNTLHAVFPDRVSRDLPNTIVRRLVDEIPHHDPAIARYVRLDIRDFYGSIDHRILYDDLSSRIRSPRLLRVLRRAIETPTIDPRLPRPRPRHRNRVGVPQGLAISNILANVYLSDLDRRLAQESATAIRFVDDILLITSDDHPQTYTDRIGELLEERRLSLNTDKETMGDLQDGFTFLGYHVSPTTVSIRNATVDRFARSIAAIFARAKRDLKTLPERSAWITPEIVRQRFIDELNEKITGAISENRRYGWVFFFLEVRDLAIFFRLDSLVRRLLERSPQLRPAKIERVKRLVRAHFEAKYSPRGGYIHDYDRFSSASDRRKFLEQRGIIRPETHLTAARVSELFTAYRDKQLTRLELDVAIMS